MATELKEMNSYPDTDSDSDEEERRTMLKRFKKFRAYFKVCCTLLIEHPGDWFDEMFTQGETAFENFRLSFKFNWTNAWWGVKIQTFYDYMSIASCALYVARTYLRPYHGCRNFETDDEGILVGMFGSSDDCTIRYFDTAEFILALFFLFNFAVQLFIANHFTDVFVDPKMSIQAATVIPTFYCRWILDPNLDYRVWLQDMSRWDLRTDNTLENMIGYLMLGLQAMVVLRLMRLTNIIDQIPNDLTRKVGEVMLNMIMMGIFYAGILQYIEQSAECDDWSLWHLDGDDGDCHGNRHLMYHTWFYYIIVTAGTVGFGEISPSTGIGRMVAIVVIVTIVILVPLATNELLQVLASTTQWQRARYHGEIGKRRWHVLVVGDLNSTSFGDFLNELLHPDHRGDVENTYLECVILQPEPPSYEIRDILRDKRYAATLTYVQGSALDYNDMMRARAHEASAIFMFCNKFSSNVDEEDAQTILLQYALKRHVLGEVPADQRKPIFCTQMIRPENRRHMLPSANVCDSMVFLNEMKLGILAKSVVCPGTAALMFNMLSSFSDEELAESAKQDIDEEWEQEYQNGFDWEMYSAALDPSCGGRKFKEIAQIVYRDSQVVLFALGVAKVEKYTYEGKEKVTYKSYRIILNPGDAIIPTDTENYKVEAFVIARSRISTISLAPTKGETIEKHLSAVESRRAHFEKIEMRHDMMKCNDLDEQEKARKIANSTRSSGKGTNSIFKRGRSSRWDVFGSGGKSPEEEESLVQRRVQFLQGKEKFDQTNFHMRDANAEQPSVKLITSIAQHAPLVNNHLIVTCGAETLHNLHDLIRPLRCKDIKPQRAVVILYPDPFPDHILEEISKYSQVFVVQGSALTESDLVRAGIFFAGRIIMLASESVAASDVGDAGMDSLVDAGSIFAYKLVRNLNRNAHVVVEIVHRQNMAFMGDQDSDKGFSNYRMSPQFASGSLFTSSMLDTLICQQFYNPELTSIVAQLISGMDREKESLYWRAILGNKDPVIDAMHGSVLIQIPVERRFWGRKYKELAIRLMGECRIPIGLYRDPDGAPSHNYQGINRLPYVVTNPDPDTKLNRFDLVFVLDQNPASPDSIQSLVDTVNNFVQNNKALKKSTAGRGGHRSSVQTGKHVLAQASGATTLTEQKVDEDEEDEGEEEKKDAL